MIARARERGLPVVGELELAWRLLPNRFVAVTGTNGKTTTVELLGAIWRAAGLPVAVAGNVGTPLSALVGEVEPDATIVCEVSSFQAEDASSFAPDIGVLLNLTPDHLDRHGSFEAYREAKLSLFARQTPDAGRDRARLDRAARGRAPRADSASCRCRRTRSACAGRTTSRTRGRAAAAARAAGVPARGGRRGAAQLRRRAAPPGGGGRRVDGVLYVNDSKATNVSSAAARDRVLRRRACT